MNKVVAVFCIGIGTYWSYEGLFTYGFWVNRGPGGGFLPIIAGVFVAVLGVFLLRANHEAVKFSPRHLVPIIAVFTGIAGLYIFGMLLTAGLMIAVWLRFVEKIPYGKTLIISLGAVMFVYGVFGLWLKVPFPQGLFGLLSL